MAQRGEAPVDRDAVVEFLGTTLPFSELDEASLRRLAQACLVDFLPAGGRLFIRGVTDVDGLFLVQKGGVRLFVEEQDGRKVLADYRGDGASVGAMSLFRRERAALDAETVEDTFFVVIPGPAFFQAVREHPEIAAYYLKSFSDAFLAKAFAAMGRRREEPPDASSLPLFNERIGSLVDRPPVAIPFGLSIRAAAREMLRHKVGSLLIREPSGNLCGIVTDKDLRKAVALGMNLEAPAETLMSAPVAAIDREALCFDALLSMMSKNIHHLAVTENDRTVGVVTSHDILVLQGRSPLSLFREIAAKNTVEELAPLTGKIPRMVRTLLEEGGRAGNITRMIAVINDRILSRILDLTLRELGPPPVKFCWLLMGSEGRREQTFATDQDNALVFEDCSEDFLERAAEVYFSAFAERVVDRLVACGFPRCPGEIMAINPLWRGPLGKWKRLFSGWIAAPEPREVMRSTIFFDFRGGHGRLELAESLRNHVMAACVGQDIFLRHLAADCLAARPPLTFFKKFIVEKNGERKNTLDIKSRGLLPFMDFARVMALRHGVRETNTLARLGALRKAGHAPEELCGQAAEAFEFLLQLRLTHQLAQVEAGRAPDNAVDPARLSALEKRTLRDAFGVAGALQAHLRDVFRLNQG